MPPQPQSHPTMFNKASGSSVEIKSNSEQEGFKLVCLEGGKFDSESSSGDEKLNK